jgi:hypothetical protein
MQFHTRISVTPLGVNIDVVVVEQLEVTTLHDDGYSDSQCCLVDMCILFQQINGQN